MKAVMQDADAGNTAQFEAKAREGTGKHYTLRHGSREVHRYYDS